MAFGGVFLTRNSNESTDLGITARTLRTLELTFDVKVLEVLVVRMGVLLAKLVEISMNDALLVGQYGLELLGR